MFPLRNITGSQLVKILNLDCLAKSQNPQLQLFGMRILSEKKKNSTQKLKHHLIFFVANYDLTAVRTLNEGV